MAQYDLILTQNMASSGVEFREKTINLPNQSLLVGGIDGDFNILPANPATQEGKVLAIGASGLEWVDLNTTMEGTDNVEWKIDMDNAGGYVKVKNNAGSTLDILTDDDSWADIHAGKGVFEGQVSGASGDFLGNIKVDTAPSEIYHLTRKDYVDNAIITAMSTNDAMVFKGVVLNQTAFEAAAGSSYSAGWTFKAGAAVSIAGHICEIGDMIICTADASGGFDNADWDVIQTSDGAVSTAETSVTDNSIVVFSGISGKLIKTSGKTLSDYTPITTFNGHVGSGASAHSLVTTSVHGFMSSTDKTKLNGIANNANLYVHHTQSGISLSASSLQVISSLTVNTEGHVTAAALKSLSSSNLPLYTSTLPTVPGSNGVKGQMAFDDNYLFLCVGTNSWRRIMLPSTWV